MPESSLAATYSAGDPQEETLALSCRNVRKVYRLYNSVKDQALDVFGLSKYLFWRKPTWRSFPALEEITLNIRRGEQVGIIGRNGAGKTTLLKLITGNFAPTSGSISVNGTVQALMQVGIGFHPDFTGYDNIRSSLLYNGLDKHEFQAAMDDIITFTELGDFLHQPVRTYSRGMRARLQFAAATAIKPEILIVDEVLGAGDAYFNSKSVERIRNLTRSGCTLLLVSHSMPQVLQFCQRVVWLDGGRVMQDGAALPVVKAYERHNHELRQQRLCSLAPAGSEKASARGKPSDSVAGDYSESGDHGVSRWVEPDSGLKIFRVRLLDEKEEETSLFEVGKPFSVDIEVQAERMGQFPCRYLVLIFAEDGTRLTRHLSPQFEYTLNQNECRAVRLSYERMHLNTGNYIASVAIYERFAPQEDEVLKAYDLLSRSFGFRVGANAAVYPALFHHPAVWTDCEPGKPPREDCWE